MTQSGKNSELFEFRALSPGLGLGVQGEFVASKPPKTSFEPKAPPMPRANGAPQTVRVLAPKPSPVQKSKPRGLSFTGRFAALSLDLLFITGGGTLVLLALALIKVSDPLSLEAWYQTPAIIWLIKQKPLTLVAFVYAFLFTYLLFMKVLVGGSVGYFLVLPRQASRKNRVPLTS